jgi:ribosomal protein L37AE/L43A
MERLSNHQSDMGKWISLLQQRWHDSTIQRSISTIETDWTIKNKELEKKKDNKNLKKHWRNTIPLNKYPSEINMSTSAAAQTVLTIVKDKFTEVLTEGTLFPTTKPTDWNVVITKKALLKAIKTPSPPPEETWQGLATLYNTTFPTLEEYRKFTVNHLVLWGNTMEYKLFNTLYVNHWNHICTIKKLWEQAMALLEEANRINERDMMIWHEIENHVRMITRSDLRQQIKKPQRIQVVTSPTPLPGPSWWPDYSHLATYGQNYSRRQYQCFQCGDPTHFKWDCPLYTCQTCNQTAPGHVPKACQGHIYDDGIHGHYDIDGYNDGNLTGECWFAHVVYVCLPLQLFKQKLNNFIMPLFLLSSFTPTRTNFY